MHWSDEELYSRVCQGDRNALAELYERREPALYRYALQLSGNHAVAEEAVHEAFLGLLEARRFDVRRGSLEAYLYGTVRNLVRAARRSAPAAVYTDAPGDEDVLRSLIGDESAAALYAAIRELPPAYREALTLCDLEERSYEDAAKLMECPVGTVRSRVHRARRLLAAKLAPLPVSKDAK